MTSDLDFAFSDENIPEGWPDIELEEVLLGEWVDGKSPSSVAMRCWLAELVRFMRAQIPTDSTPTERQDELRFIREFHRKYRPDAVEAEASLIEFRRKMLPDWKLWCARPKGGVQ